MNIRSLATVLVLTAGLCISGVNSLDDSIGAVETRPYYAPEKSKAVNYRIKTSRSFERESLIFEVTAYTADECDKSVTDPLYGITASGTIVQEWHTVAAPKSIPFGTRIYIPYFKDMPNGGIFVVEDRGGAITEGHLDIYWPDYNEAVSFGRKMLEVQILAE